MDSSVATQIIILIILLLFSGLFSSAETSLTTVNKIRMRSLAEDGNKRAKKVIAITEDSGKMLSAILIGNNIVNLSASSITTSIAYMFGGSAVAIATGIITLLILIFGEISPKTLATIHSEKLALFYAYPVDFVMKIMTPFIIIINSLSRVVLFILRVNPNAKPDTMTESELRTIVDVSHEDGVIESEEKEMIYNVFDMGDAKAKDVMVPRVHMTFADVNSTYEELIDIFREDKFTRLPVYEETTDNVIGTINMKDLLLFDNKKEFHIRDILREAYFTYEYKSISELLVEMREASFNIAIVLDEYGETAGLITLEDLLEEIVGEIDDETDKTSVEVREIGENTYIVEGSMTLNDFNEHFDTELESDDVDTIAGYYLTGVGAIPTQEVKEHYAVINKDKHLEFINDKVKDGRVTKLKVIITAAPEEAGE